MPEGICANCETAVGENYNNCPVCGAEMTHEVYECAYCKQETDNVDLLCDACDAENAKPRCAHIVSDAYPDGPTVTCSNPVREQSNYMRRNRIEPKYCEEHDDVRDDSYTDVSITFEGALDSIETFYDSTPGDIARMRDYLFEEENAIVEQIEAYSPERLLEHIANGGARIESAYHNHEFDSREDYEAWQDEGAECFCESYSTDFNSIPLYEAKLRALSSP